MDECVVADIVHLDAENMFFLFISASKAFVSSGGGGEQLREDKLGELLPFQK